MKCSICRLEDPTQPAFDAQSQCESCARNICKLHTETCCDIRQCTLCYAEHLQTALPPLSPESAVIVNLIKSSWPTGRKEVA